MAFHVLEFPTKKVGHPNVVDMVVSENKSSCDLIASEEVSTSVAAVCKDSSVIMLIEVKKVIPAKFLTNEPSDVLKMLIYCRYVSQLYVLTLLVGVLTDGSSWHCMMLGSMKNGRMKLLKYHHFTCTDELKIIGTIPELLNL